MDQQTKSGLWFFLSFALSFGAYLAVHLIAGNDSYGVLEFTVAILAIPVLLLAWGIARGYNRPLAEGFACGLAAIFIFLFSFGGCGLIRIG